jgi:lipase maturation factor 1
MLYDGECAFCRQWTERWARTAGERVEFVPAQQAAGRFPAIPAQAFKESVQLVEPDGRWTSGAEAVFRALGTNPRFRWTRMLYERLPGAAFVSEAVYRWVARHRSTLGQLR